MTTENEYTPDPSAASHVYTVESLGHGVWRVSKANAHDVEVITGTLGVMAAINGFEWAADVANVVRP